jgi:hypothetical protein
MVAVAIFALACVYLASSYLNILKGYQMASTGLQEDPDVAFARGQVMQIADLATAEAGLEYDTPDSSPLDPSRHVKWTADIEPFTGSTATAPTDVFTVTLTVVVSGSGGQPRTTVDVFNLLRPTWSDPTARSTQRQANTSAILQLQGKTAQ